MKEVSHSNETGHRKWQGLWQLKKTIPLWRSLDEILKTVFFKPLFKLLFQDGLTGADLPSYLKQPRNKYICIKNDTRQWKPVAPEEQEIAEVSPKSAPSAWEFPGHKASGTQQPPWVEEAAKCPRQLPFESHYCKGESLRQRTTETAKGPPQVFVQVRKLTETGKRTTQKH